MSMTRRAAILGGAISAVALGQQPVPDKYPDVPYVPTPMEVVEGMLKLADVHASDVVYDLGCGDGRIVLMAAEKFGAASAVGVELDSDLVREARERAKKSPAAKRVKFIEADLFETDIRPASVVTLYLIPKVIERLKPKLLNELKPGSRIVSFTFPIPEWTSKTGDVNGRPFYLYIVPDRPK